MKRQVCVVWLLLGLAALAALPLNVDADIVMDPVVDSSFVLIKHSGETFVVQDLYHGLNLNFTVATGDLYSLCTLYVNSSGGAFTFYSSTAATLSLNTNGYVDPLQLLVDGASYLGVVAVPVHQVVTVSWLYRSPVGPTPTPAAPSPTPTAVPTAPAATPTATIIPTISPTWAPTPNPLFPTSISSSGMWQYLYNWDFVGFIIATWTFNLGQSFFVILAFIVSLAIYIRYQNLIAIGIMWIVLGSVFVVWIPMVTPFIIFAFAFGIGSLIYKVYESRN